MSFLYYTYFNNSVSAVPDYMTEQFTRSLEEKHVFTIENDGNNYTLVDTTQQNEYLISSTSKIAVDEYVDKKFYLSGNLFMTQNQSVSVFGAEENDVSAVVVHIEDVEIVE